MAALNAGSYSGLFLLCIGLAWFDLRTRRIPNLITLLLFGTGAFLHFPGDPATWLGCLLLVCGWQAGYLGGGDAKLWIALFWWVPEGHGPEALYVFGLSWLVSGGFQLAWRWVTGKPGLSVRSPAAWRTLPFAAWLLLFV